MMLLLSITACGGGGGQPPDATSPPAQPPSSQPPTSRGTLVVTVTDLLGAPISGADVEVWTRWEGEDKAAVTDTAGVAEIGDVIASTVSVRAGTPSTYGALDEVVIEPGGTRNVTVMSVPAVGPTGGVAGVALSPMGIGDDGRTLQFSLELLAVPDPRIPSWIERTGDQASLGFEELKILSCSPNPDNDGSRQPADCVAGGDGFDAPYDGTLVSVEVSTARGYDAVFRPSFIAALLLDQSASAITDDPADLRLFAAQYFLTQTPMSSFQPLVEEVALAAFAADDTTNYQAALIPQKPVTVFPTENPRYVSGGRELLPDVESLTVLEGGAAPLFAAIDRMLDFAGGRTETVSSLIVISNGRDQTCGDRSQCRAQLDALVRKSRDLGVAVVTVGLEGPSGTVDYETLSALAQSGSGGAMFLAKDPHQLAPILGVALAHKIREQDSATATFRIRSPEAGTFVSGRTVIGQVRVAVCPFDCTVTDIPFAVRIP
jgi:hypothetical protein